MNLKKVLTLTLAGVMCSAMLAGCRDGAGCAGSQAGWPVT